MQNLLKSSILFLILLTFNTLLHAQTNPFTGTWNSSYGNLMLVQVGNQVYDPYKRTYSRVTSWTKKTVEVEPRGENGWHSDQTELWFFGDFVIQLKKIVHVVVCTCRFPLGLPKTRSHLILKIICQYTPSTSRILINFRRVKLHTSDR